jgi:hypothetical protein
MLISRAAAGMVVVVLNRAGRDGCEDKQRGPLFSGCCFNLKNSVEIAAKRHKRRKNKKTYEKSYQKSIHRSGALKYFASVFLCAFCGHQLLNLVCRNRRNYGEVVSAQKRFCHREHWAPTQRALSQIMVSS